MYAKKSPIKEVKYYVLLLGVISVFQVIVAININKHDKVIGWDTKEINNMQVNAQLNEAKEDFSPKTVFKFASVKE